MNCYLYKLLVGMILFLRECAFLHTWVTFDHVLAKYDKILVLVGATLLFALKETWHLMLSEQVNLIIHRLSFIMVTMFTLEAIFRNLRGFSDWCLWVLINWDWQFDFFIKDMFAKLHLAFEGSHTRKTLTILGVIVGQMFDEFIQLQETSLTGYTFMTLLIPLAHISDEGFILMCICLKPIFVV